MVEALGPAKFYGSILPRPRFYKANEERVDPPVSVIDPLMSWAEETHGSMGGMNFTRHRLQGRIEGNIEKLRTELEKVEKKTGKETPAKGSTPFPDSPSPPPAPYVLKRKRFLIDESEVKERVGRKLGDEFDRVAEESRFKSGGAVKAVARRTRSRRNEDAVAEVVNQVKAKGKLKEGLKDGEKVVSSTRTSPRLLKRRSP